MAWQVIPTLSGGNVLTDEHLNLLNDNADFLYDITNRSNWPCPSLHRNTVGGFDRSSTVYTFRHRLRWLHFYVENLSNTLAHNRIYYNNELVAEDTTPASGPFTGAVDLYTPTTWPKGRGAWATATAYNGDGDGDIVSHGGNYYRCIADHTSNASTEPGVGASWETVWDPLLPPTVGAVYEAWVDADFVSGTGELAVDYLEERDSG